MSTTTFLDHPVLVSRKACGEHQSKPVQGLAWLKRNGNIVTSLVWESNPKRGPESGTLSAFTIGNDRWLYFPLATKKDFLAIAKQLMPETIRIDQKIGSPADFPELKIREAFFATARPRRQPVTTNGSACYA